MAERDADLQRTSPARRALVLLGGSVLAYLVLLAFPLDALDPTDEHEWTAISIAHVGQLFGGETPPGAQPGEPEWRAGVQATTFGAVNPCFAKLVLGAVLRASGFRTIRPEVFQRFGSDDPNAARRARAELDPALPTARAVVRVVTALCAGLVAAIAFELGGSLAASLAWAAFAWSPLVRTWGAFVRTDFFMLAAALGVVWLALATRGSLAGGRGRARKLWLAAGLGVLAGIATASKLNGAPSLVVALAAIALAHGRRAWQELVAALGLCAGAALAILWLVDPVLWRDPLGEARAILAFWDEHMRFQQGRAALQGLTTPQNPLESLRFAAWAMASGGEPIVALTGIRVGWLVALAGLALLAVRAWRADLAARVALAGTVLFGGATAAWIPIDWGRYVFPLVALAAVLEGLALARGAAFVRARARAAGARKATE